jgi:hypothetical protein
VSPNEQYHKIYDNLKSKSIAGAQCNLRSIISGTTNQYDNALAHCFRLPLCYFLYDQFLRKQTGKRNFNLMCSLQGGTVVRQVLHIRLWMAARHDVSAMRDHYVGCRVS